MVKFGEVKIDWMIVGEKIKFVEMICVRVRVTHSIVDDVDDNIV